MSNSYVADTMALVLRLERRRLPQEVKAVFEEAENDNAGIFIPAMVLAEIGYLSERRRIETNLTEVKLYCSDHKLINVEPITELIIEKSFQIDDIPELHDRIIAGTAYSMELQLLTNDPIISESKYISVVW